MFVLGAMLVVVMPIHFTLPETHILYISAEILLVVALGYALYRQWYYYTNARAMRLRVLHAGKPELFSSLPKPRPPFFDIAECYGIRSLEVANGVGRDRGTVVVTVEWPGLGDKRALPPVGQKATLYLYRDTGEIQLNEEALRARSSAIRLDFAVNNEPLRFIDANVQEGTTYNYYAWVEVELWLVIFAAFFTKKAHVARFNETRREYAERRLSEQEILERLQRAKTPPPAPSPATPAAQPKLENAASLEEFMSRYIQATFDRDRDYTRAVKKIEELVRSAALDPAEEERRFKDALRTLDAEAARRGIKH